MCKEREKKVQAESVYLACQPFTMSKIIRDRFCGDSYHQDLIICLNPPVFESF